MLVSYLNSYFFLFLFLTQQTEFLVPISKGAEIIPMSATFSSTE